MADVMQSQREMLARVEDCATTGPRDGLTFGWARLPVGRSGDQQVYCFVATLHHSRLRFARFAPQNDVATLKRCLLAAFAYFGGVPALVCACQPQPALGRLASGAWVWHPDMVAFASAFGFHLQARLSYRGCPGQSVALAARHTRLASAARGVAGQPALLDELNRQALIRCAEWNWQPHPATGQVPFLRADMERLAPLPDASLRRQLVRRETLAGSLRAAIARLAAPAAPTASTAARQRSFNTSAPVNAPVQEQPREDTRTRAEATYWASWGAARNGARIVVTRAQKYVLTIISFGVLLLLLVWPHTVIMSCIAFMIALYAATSAHKIWLLLRGENAIAYGAADGPRQPDDLLPVYTVLVPLHREGRILPFLVERLDSLDYPRDRLQVLLLVEMDDQETLAAARKCSLPSHMTVLVMPPGQPRTKPRALNVGLRESRGEYIVIFDAEDRPEPDQLRKAVAAFAALPEDVVCVQGRLNFYNWRQSLLTRLFAVDYATWYDQLLPGLSHVGRQQSGSFVPLGGTSNHFRVQTLREIGGWDPYNVTEDCDLGVRLGRAGLRVAMLDSTTWEEAVPHVRPWIRQRSRWIKGYVQTYLVHMRHPLLLLRQLGPRGFVDFQILVGASCLVLLINPLMWALTLLYMVCQGTALDAFIQTLFPAPLYYPALLNLVVGNFIFFYSNAYVCVRHDHMRLTRFALLTPAYWILMSIGAWSGLFSLIRNPFYWAKTEHGVSLPQPEAAPTLAAALGAGYPARSQSRWRNRAE